mgnify:CR=1 FL=1
MTDRNLTTSDVNVPGGIAGLDPNAAIAQAIVGVIDAARLHGVPLANVIAALTAQNRITDAIPKSWINAKGGVAGLDTDGNVTAPVVSDLTGSYLMTAQGTTIDLLSSLSSAFYVDATDNMLKLNASIPTSDPKVASAIWMNGGYLMVSQGE